MTRWASGTVIALLQVQKEAVIKTMLLKKKLFASVLGLTLLLGIGLASANSVAQAQWQDRDWQREQEIRRQREWEREQRRRHRDDDRYRDDSWRYGNGGSFDARQTALNAGYN